MRWIDGESVSKGVRERQFDLQCEGRRVPGVLWTPPDAQGPRPLVLLGHGGTLHKLTGYVRAMARRFVRHHGYAAAAIDGPGHGDRRADEGQGREIGEREFDEIWARPGVTDESVADWKATLDALEKQDEVGPGQVVYWGLSMGTIFGLPFVASEPRIQAAVLGLMGVTGPTAGRMARDATRISCPVFFLQQWHDELFPRESVITLFDLIASRDKCLHANPGKHAAVPPAEMFASEAFLASRLDWRNS